MLSPTESPARVLCCVLGGGGQRAQAMGTCPIPSHPLNRVQWDSLEGHRGQASHTHCWELSTGFTANHHRTGVGRRCTQAVKNKAQTHSSYLIPRDSPLSVLRVPAPCP